MSGVKIGSDTVIDENKRGIFRTVFPGAFASTTADDPGDIYYSTTDTKPYFWNGSEWKPLGSVPTGEFLVMNVTSGSYTTTDTTTSEGTFRQIVFTSSGSVDITQLADTERNNSVKYFIVGGGGAGATAGSGGGGAGGVIEGQTTPHIGTCTVTVGAGGGAATNYGVGNVGGYTQVFGARAEGGGGGKRKNTNDPFDYRARGASGGGGASKPNTPTSEWFGGISNKNAGGNSPGLQLPQGNDGGDGYTPGGGLYRVYGGGGGASAAGGNASGSNSGQGGAGVLSPDWVPNTLGESGYFSGGGGGGYLQIAGFSNGQTSGGIGGGGDGWASNGTGTNRNGQANTGGGGGGGLMRYEPSYEEYNGGTGGSGIVVIQYRLS